MAKKNLHSLMSGIIGSDNNTPLVPENTAQRNHGAEDLSPKSPAILRGPGRPKKADGNDDTRATFIISAELLRKIKYISLMEDSMQKDVVGEALSLYVSKWEQDNGKIKLPKK